MGAKSQRAKEAEMERRCGSREEGIGRRNLVREHFEGDVTPETHHAFARPDVHKVLAEFGYWLNEFDGDLSTYARRGTNDSITTHRLDGSWRHVIPGEERKVEGQGSENLRKHLRQRERDRDSSAQINNQLT